MKTNTPAAPTPAKKTKPAARTGSRQPSAKSLALPLPAVPTVWKIAAKDLGFPSVEAWAAAMLDTLAWPGNRFTITPPDGQLERWSKAAVSQGMTFPAWLASTLDAASESEKSQPTTTIQLDAEIAARLGEKLRVSGSDQTAESIIHKFLADTLEDGWLESLAEKPQTLPQA